MRTSSGTSPRASGGAIVRLRANYWALALVLPSSPLEGRVDGVQRRGQPSSQVASL